MTNTQDTIASLAAASLLYGNLRLAASVYGDAPITGTWGGVVTDARLGYLQGKAGFISNHGVLAWTRQLDHGSMARLAQIVDALPEASE